MALTADQVQKFYIGYYARPADPIGLAYWQTQDEAAALKGFSESAEFTNQFQGLSASQQVTKVYNNLLGRAPDTDGLKYWAGELTSGRETIGTLVLSMTKNALGKDVTTIEDRVTYSNSFTTALDTVEEINAYAGATATQTARDALLKVVATAVGDHTALTAETAKIDATIATIVSGGGAPGQDFTLTTGVDDIVAAKDGATVVGLVDTNNSVSTLNSGDKISGGNFKGVTLNVVLDGTTYAGTAKIDKVDVINVQSVGANTFVATGVTNAKEIWSNQSTNATTISNLDTLDTTIGIKDTDAHLTANWLADKVTGTSDTAKIALSGATGGAVNGVTLSAGIETVKVASTGGIANDILAVVGTGTAMKTLQISGDQNLRMRAVDADVTRIDAGAVDNVLKGNLRVDTLAGTGNVTVIGGDGDDRVDFATTFTKDDVVDLGAGTNRLDISMIATITDVLSIKNVHTLGLDSNGAWTHNMKGVTLNTVQVNEDGNADTVGLNNLGLIENVAYVGNGNDAAQTFDNLTLGFSATAVSGDADTVAIAVSNQGRTLQDTNDINLGNLTANGIEVMNLTVAQGDIDGGAGAGTPGLTITNAALEKLKIVSPGDVDFVYNSTNIKKLDFSAVEGKVTTTLTDSTNASSVILGSGGSELSMVANAGGENVIITLGAGLDNVVLATGIFSNTVTIGDMQKGDLIDVDGFLTAAPINGASEAAKGDVDADGEWFYDNVTGVLTIWDDVAGNAAIDFQLDAGLDTAKIDIVGATVGANNYITLVAV